MSEGEVEKIARIEGELKEIKQEEVEVEQLEQRLHKREERLKCELEEAHRDVAIEVNTRRVVMPSHEATGLEIKQAAISQGVKIDLDFVLSVLRDGKWDNVGNDQRIDLHNCEKFNAVAPDDNS